MSCLRWIAREHRRKHKGLKLISEVPERAEDFFRLMKMAVNFLEKYDRRRFSRLTKRIKLIVDTRIGFTCYRRLYNSVETDMGVFTQSLRGQERIILYASALVHESTHALIADRLSRPIRESERTRVERLCLLEEARFLKRIPSAERFFRSKMGTARTFIYNEFKHQLLTKRMREWTQSMGSSTGSAPDK